MSLESNAHYIACRAAEAADKIGSSPDEITQTYIDSYVAVMRSSIAEYDSSILKVKDESWRKGFEACKDAHERRVFSTATATSPKWWKFWE